MGLLVALRGSVAWNREGILKRGLLPVLTLDDDGGLDKLDNGVRSFLRVAIDDELMREGAALAQPDELHVTSGGIEISIHKVRPIVVSVVYVARGNNNSSWVLGSVVSFVEPIFQGID